jgi:hypothetical protein
VDHQTVELLETCQRHLVPASNHLPDLQASLTTASCVEHATVEYRCDVEILMFLFWVWIGSKRAVEVAVPVSEDRPFEHRI